MDFVEKHNSKMLEAQMKKLVDCDFGDDSENIINTIS